MLTPPLVVDSCDTDSLTSFSKVINCSCTLLN
nr:MAG TPA: hypothetical protein [Bacteriophage sp.]